VGRGGDSGPARRRARAGARLRRPSCSPRQETAREREGDGVSMGPTRQREWKGGTVLAVDGGVNRLSGGGEPGRRWARRRFAAGDPVLGQRVGALVRGGAGEPRGGSIWLEGARRGLSAGRWRSSAAGVVAGELRAGIGAEEWRPKFMAVWRS
jgi:hypothetical protein